MKVDIGLILSILLGAGGLGGLATLFRRREDRGAVLVDTASRSVLLLERLNERLENELAEERKARRRAERRADRTEARLRKLGQPIVYDAEEER